MPVTLLYGDNALEIEAAAHSVRAKFSEVDTILYDGATVSLAELSQTCQTVGLFDPERLVVVRGLEGRLKGGKKGVETDELRRTLASVAPTTTLLLLSPEMDDKNGLIDMVREVSGQVRSFVTPKRAELPRWIAARGSAHGVTVRRDAAELLADMLGANSVLLDTEVEKLAVYAGEGGTISTEVVETLVGAVTQDTIFALVDAVAVGDKAKALRLMQAQRGASSSTPIDFALYLVRMLARQVRILLRIRLGQEAGKSTGQITSDLKLNRYFAERYFRHARRLSTVRLTAAFEQLAAFEHGIKSGRADAGIGLDLLVTELCS
jgi:DNA polymerase III subunit delta